MDDFLSNKQTLPPSLLSNHALRQDVLPTLLWAGWLTAQWATWTAHSIKNSYFNCNNLVSCISVDIRSRCDRWHTVYFLSPWQPPQLWQRWSNRVCNKGSLYESIWIWRVTTLTLKRATQWMNNTGVLSLWAHLLAFYNLICSPSNLSNAAFFSCVQHFRVQ